MDKTAAVDICKKSTGESRKKAYMPSIFVIRAYKLFYHIAASLQSLTRLYFHISMKKIRVIHAYSNLPIFLDTTLVAVPNNARDNLIHERLQPMNSTFS